MTLKQQTNTIRTKILDVKVDILISAIYSAIPEEETKALAKVPVKSISEILQAFAFMTGSSREGTTRGVAAVICRQYFALCEKEGKHLHKANERREETEGKTNGKNMKANERARNRRNLPKHHVNKVRKKRKPIGKLEYIEDE